MKSPRLVQIGILTGLLFLSLASQAFSQTTRTTVEPQPTPADPEVIPSYGVPGSTLPYCPDATTAQPWNPETWKKRGPTSRDEENAPASCKLKSYDQTTAPPPDYDPALDRRSTTAPSLAPTAPTQGSSGSQAPDELAAPPALPGALNATGALPGYAWAVHQLSSCTLNTTNCTWGDLYEFRFNVSGNTPSIAPQNLPTSHFYNRAHWVAPTNYVVPTPCVINGIQFGGGSEQISVGYAYGGAFVGNIFFGRIIIEHFGRSNATTAHCEIHDTGISISGNGTVLIRIFRTTDGRWALDIWNDGTWQRMRDYYAAWTAARIVEYGQEIAGVGNVQVPVNYILKARVSGRSNSLRPVSAAVLQSPLTQYASVEDPPFVVLDSVTNEMTSVTSKTP